MPSPHKNEISKQYCKGENIIPVCTIFCNGLFVEIILHELATIVALKMGFPMIDQLAM